MIESLMLFFASGFGRDLDIFKISPQSVDQAYFAFPYPSKKETGVFFPSKFNL
jgi:hypothetical protein